MGEAKRRQRLDPNFGWVPKNLLAMNVSGCSETSDSEIKKLGLFKINESISDRLGISGYLEEILVKARECNILDPLTLSKHIWHQIVTDGTEVSYLMVAVNCMAMSMKQFLPDNNMFPGDLLTSLSDQSRGGSEDANNLAIKLIHAPLAKLVSH